ncbi:hypothetical protein DIPPA_30939 [Diplonema papillatum]|nr:hypothetical protein DIPPA_30939 [Diplonema papillatum]
MSGAGDGNCQFSAIAQRHGTVDAVRLRRMAVDEMEAPNDRELTVAEELARWQAYLEAMRRNATYGDELTLRAASRVLRCDIWVLNATSRRGCRQPAPTATIILTYRPEHYDAMLSCCSCRCRASACWRRRQATRYPWRGSLWLMPARLLARPHRPAAHQPAYPSLRRPGNRTRAPARPDQGDPATNPQT